MASGPYSIRRGLYRSRRGVFLGVCRGVAERFDLSPWGLRLLFLALQLTVVPYMFLIYIALALLMKRMPRYCFERHLSW